ncbi:MAG: M13 family metallopeptidase [Prevotellaceae bacterium]|jgi:putative endopeptidase|nr:M13 family metallopeptidase [Prevotellaceae bacterium]
MKKIFIYATMIATPALLATSCGRQQSQALTSGIHQEYLDTTVSPKQDFYQYACGGWMALHPLTAEYARFGSFDKLAEDNQKQLKELIVSIAERQHKSGSIPQKIGDLYNLGMDSATTEQQGAEPLKTVLTSLLSLQTKEGLTDKLAELALDGTSPLFGVFGEADPNNSTQRIAWIWQTGLGIGDRDYYLEAGMKDKRDAYVVLLSKLLSLSGYAEIAGLTGQEEAAAKQVLALETELATAFMDKNTMRDPYKTSNIRTVDEWQKLIPSIDVKRYLAALGLQEVTSVNIGQPDYTAALNKIIEKTDINTIRTYLACQIITGAAPYLNSAFVDAHFDFFGKTLSGRTEQRPRWKRVVGTVDGVLGEAVGQMYVEKYFPAAAKERMLQLVDNLKEALRERIAQNGWMNDSTKDKSFEKLDAFIVKIGYPDQWRDYSSLTVAKDSYFANIERAQRFETAYHLAKIGKPIDPKEWLMTPQTVNAYYNPTTNEICFPAGILQPPFFDMYADDAVNYGAIGVVIGHEMTHGFDDQGRNYDKNGNLSNWWGEDDAVNFAARTKVLVDYFDNIDVLPGVKANGTFTLGENIADNGGLNVSFVALQKAKAQGTITDVMDDFSADERFFIAYANVWAGNVRDEEIVRRTKEDPHSLGRWRVNGALPHINVFAQTYNLQEGDAMYLAPEKRADIW